MPPKLPFAHFPVDEKKEKKKQNPSRPKEKSLPQHYFSPKPITDLKIKRNFESIRGVTLNLETATGTFSPDHIDKGTRILIESMIIPNEGPILDLGTGYGPISIWLENYYKNELFFSGKQEKDIPLIYASEINERALWLLKRNIKNNQCTHIKILKGDFLSHYSSLKAEGIKFKAIISNPPLKRGHAAMLELFEKACDLLDEEEGFLQYVHKKKLGAPGFLNKLQNILPSWIFKVIKKKGGYHVIVGAPRPFMIEENNEGTDSSDWF